jgi:hypothetical protein
MLGNSGYVEATKVNLVNLCNVGLAIHIAYIGIYQHFDEVSTRQGCFCL